jgi:integrase
MGNSKPRQAARVERPDWRKAMGLHPDYPLFPHPNGCWCKKVRGEQHYFGTVAADPKGKAALEEWLRVKDDLIAGREPRPKGDGMTVREMCDRFLVAKAKQRDTGELTPLSWSDYKRTSDRIVKYFGNNRIVTDLTAEDLQDLKTSFAKSGVKGSKKTRGLVGIGNDVQRARVLFGYAFAAGLIDRPLPLQLFRRPSKKVLRMHKAKLEAEHGKKMFAPAEIQALLDKATPQLKSMILLATNCGYGNNDCATLTFRALDLDGGWVTHARPKTGIDRRCPLWPETVAAIKNAIEKRRTPKDEAQKNLVFVTAALGSFAKDTSDSPITKELAKLVNELELKQKGRGFCSLRHTFRSVARHAKDLDAVRQIMGHQNVHVEEGYEHEPVEDERLRAVVEHVRMWLWPPEEKKVNEPKKQTKTTRQKVPQPRLRVVG